MKKYKRVKKIRKSISIAIIAIISICILALCGCVSQKPVSQAPVYNITLTDNSQIIVGDNNAAESRPLTKTEQSATPVADSRADNTTSNMWILWLILIVAATIGIYLLYRKYKTGRFL